MYILQRAVHKTQKSAPLNDACRIFDSNKMNNPSTSKLSGALPGLKCQLH